MSGVNGALDILVMKNPGEWYEGNGDFNTGLQIEPQEWEELFFNVLHAPQNETKLVGENFSKYFTRSKKIFQENLQEQGYEMLGRIWDIYQDAEYCPKEINQLYEECLEIQQRTQNKYALSALKKLIFGCQEALKIKSGLFLSSD